MKEEQLKELHAALGRFRRRWRQVQALNGLATVLVVAAALFLLAGGVDFLINLGLRTRYLFTALYYVAVAGAFAFWVVRPLIRPVAAVKVAWLVEGRNPALDERFATIVQLTSGDQTYGSQEMIGRLMDEALTSLTSISARKTFPLFEAGMAWKLGALAMIGLWVSIPGLKGDDLLARLIWPTEAQASVGAFSLEFSPIPQDTIIEGEPVVFTLKTDNRAVRTVALMLKFPDGRLRRETLTRRDYLEDFTFTYDNPYHDFSYWARAGKVKTQTRRLAIRKRPKIDSFGITYTPPSHAGLPSVQFESTTGDLKALANTNVDVNMVASSPLSKAEVTFEGQSVPVELSPDRQSARFRLLIDRSGTYEVKLYDAVGLTNSEGTRYRVTMIPDAKPKVTVFEPAGDLFVPSDGLVHFEWTARDDLRVVKQEIQCQVVNGERYVYPLPSNVDDADVELDRLRVTDGNEILLTLHVYDALRQEAVSDPVRVVVLDAPGFDAATDFRSGLDEVMKEIAEANERLNDLQSSIQDVLLARKSNVGKNADLGHQLLMLDHRVERVDKQLLLILDSMSAAFDDAFFPHAHQALDLMMNSLGQQVVFGNYHRDMTLDRIRKGCFDCRSLLIRSRRVCEQLKRHSGQFIVNALGVRALASAKDAELGAEVDAIIRSKARLFLSILSKDDAKGLDAIVSSKTGGDALLNEFVQFLSQNESKIGDSSRLLSETKMISRAHRPLVESLLGISHRLQSAEAVDWKRVRRFAAVLDATRDRVATQVGDWSILQNYFELTLERKDAQLFAMGVDAWERMRRARLSLQLEWMTGTVMSQFMRGDADKSPKMALDLLDVLETFPIGGMHKDRGPFVQSIEQALALVRAHLSGDSKTAPDLMQAVNACQEAVAGLARHDMDWRRLVRKAMIKKMPAPSDRLARSVAKFKEFSDLLDMGEIGTLGQLEQILHELTMFALRLEKQAVGEIAQVDADVQSIRFNASVAYAIFELLEKRVQPMVNRYSMLQTFEDYEIEDDIVQLKNETDTVVVEFRTLLQLLEDWEAAERGERSFKATAELRQRALLLAGKSLPAELSAHLNMVELLRDTRQQFRALNGQIRKVEFRRGQVPPEVSQLKGMAGTALSVMDARLPDRWRNVVIADLNEARQELRRLAQSLAAQRVRRGVAIDILKRAEDLAGLLGDTERLMSRYFIPATDVEWAFRAEVVEPMTTGITVNASAFQAIERSRAEIGDMVLRVISTPTTTTVQPADMQALSNTWALEQAKKLASIENLLIQLSAFSDLIAPKEKHLTSIRRRGAKLLDEVMGELPKRHPVRRYLAQANSNRSRMTLQEYTALMKRLVADLGTRSSAKPVKAFLDSLAKADGELADLPQLIRNRDRELRGLLRLARELEKSMRQGRANVVNRHLEFLAGDLKDNLQLKDYDAATRNVRSLYASLNQNASYEDYFADPLVAPLDNGRPATDAAPTLDDGNPLVLRTLVLLRQQERLHPKLKRELAFMIRDGEYEKALRLMPENCGESLRMAQRFDWHLPSPEDVPVRFVLPSRIEAGDRTPISEDMFDLCSHAHELGNNQAVEFALNGDLEAAADSMKAYADQVRDEVAAEAAARLAERFRRTVPVPFSLENDGPLEAVKAIGVLDEVIAELGVIPIPRLLVILAEQGRIYRLIKAHRFKDAADAAFAVSNLFQDRSLRELWTVLYRLQRKDESLFGNGPRAVRQALIGLYPKHDAIRLKALEGKYREAADMAEQAGYADLAKVLRNSMAHQAANMPATIGRAMMDLQRCREMVDDSLKEPLAGVMSALKRRDLGSAKPRIAGILESMNFPVSAYKRLSTGLQRGEYRQSCFRNAKELVMENRFRQALLVLSQVETVEAIDAAILAAEAAVTKGKRHAIGQSLMLRSVGKKSALRAAFDKAVRHDLAMAHARSKAAGEEGASAASSFAEAAKAKARATSLIDDELNRLEQTMSLDDSTLERLAGLADTEPQRRALVKQLGGGFYHHALRRIKTLKPTQVKLYEIVESLGAYESQDRARVADALTAPLDQHLRFFYRALFKLRGIDDQAPSEMAMAAVSEAESLLDKSMALAADRGRDLMQRLLAKRSKKQTSRAIQPEDAITADRRAWIERLEKATAFDGGLDGMALMSNFQIGRKRNYAGYYQAANRNYFKWLTSESKTLDQRHNTSRKGDRSYRK